MTLARTADTRAHRWDPFGLLTEMEAEMERLLGRASGRTDAASVV